MKTSEILSKAADLLAQPNAFSKGAFAYGRAGNPVPPKSKHACSWCIAGAIAKVSTNVEERKLACYALENALDKNIPLYNDAKRTTQASAVRKLRQAAKAVAK